MLKTHIFEKPVPKNHEPLFDIVFVYSNHTMSCSKLLKTNMAGNVDGDDFAEACLQQTK